MHPTYQEDLCWGQNIWKQRRVVRLDKMLVPEKKTLHNLATPNFVFIMKIKTLSCKNPNQPVVEKTFSCQDQEINKKHKLSDKTRDGIMITSDS